MNETAQHEERLFAQWYQNHYVCSDCDAEWIDEWSCMCNDRCPECSTEMEPIASIDLSRQLVKEDYIGAARLLTGTPNATGDEVTAEHAQKYAEAMMEGGEYRFAP